MTAMDTALFIFGCMWLVAIAWSWREIRKQMKGRKDDE